MEIDWNAVSAISSIFTMMIIAITAVFAANQLREMRRSGQVSAFIGLYQLLQDEDTRQSRKKLFEANEKNIDLDEWSADERKAAEKVCSTYDVAGIMVEKGIIDKEFILEWHYSIVRSWESAWPIIEKYRSKRGNDYWKNFEKLYKMSKN